MLNFLVNNCSVLKASFVLPACETDEAAPLKVQSQEEAEVAAKIIILVANTLLPPGIFFLFFSLLPGIYDNRSK